MMNETDEMRDARHALERLSASDPAAQANMLRYVAAVRIMLTGRRRGDVDAPPLIGAGFRLMGGAVEIPAAHTREDGADRIYIAFDVDDAAGPAIGLGLFRKDDDLVSCYGLCRLWSPANDGRAIIIPADDGSLGSFSFKSGDRLQRASAPTGDLADRGPSSRLPSRQRPAVEAGGLGCAEKLRGHGLHASHHDQERWNADRDDTARGMRPWGGGGRPPLHGDSGGSTIGSLMEGTLPRANLRNIREGREY